MIKRVAFFAKKDKVENYFNIDTLKESLFEPHYNLSPGQQLPAVTGENGSAEINQVRWGDRESGKTVRTEIPIEKLTEVIQDDKAERCILPLSGFFVWKDEQEESHPFFVRLLNSPVMSVAGVYHDKKSEYLSIVTTEAHSLIQPMSDRMPLFMKQKVALQWLEPSIDTEDLIEEIKKDPFMLTDLSVTRVSKDVNDPTNNSPDLIQPIPK